MILTVSQEVAAGTERSWRGSSWRRWSAFHLAVLVAGGLLLWAFSVPGFSFVVAAIAVMGLAVAGLFWVGRLLAAWRQGTRWSWWFAVAPSMVVIVVFLLAYNVPLRARWAASSPAFEAVVSTMLLTAEPGAGDRWTPVAAPATIGGYRIIQAYRVPGGVIFYEQTGNITDDAGFAYLPNGPSRSLEDGSFESPVYRHLGGSWYAWTASW